MKKVKSMAGTGKNYLEVIPGVQFRVRSDDMVHFQISSYTARSSYIVVDVPVNELVRALNYIKECVKED